METTAVVEPARDRRATKREMQTLRVLMRTRGVTLARVAETGVISASALSVMSNGVQPRPSRPVMLSEVRAIRETIIRLAEGVGNRA